MASASVPSKDNRVDVSFLSESESEAEDASVHSDPIADYVPSETSDDRAFVVSDTEEQSSHASSNDFANDGILARRDEMDSKAVQEDMHSKNIRPIKIMAKRSAVCGDGPTTEYLVLWYSWETADKALDTIESMADLRID